MNRSNGFYPQIIDFVPKRLMKGWESALDDESVLALHPSIVEWSRISKEGGNQTVLKNLQTEAFLVRDGIMFPHRSMWDRVEGYAVKLGWIMSPDAITSLRQTRFLESIKRIVYRMNRKEMDFNLLEYWEKFSIQEEVKGSISSNGKWIVIDKRWNRVNRANNPLLYLYQLCTLEELNVLGW